MAYVPLIITREHTAILRSVKFDDKRYYRFFFEGKGFIKVWPQKFRTPCSAYSFLRRLGFTKCKIIPATGSSFTVTLMKNEEWKDKDGHTSWFDCYEHHDLIPEEYYANSN